jgi:hypothetical protein
MDTKYAPIRNETSSFALTLLRLLLGCFIPERPIALIEALAASMPVIHVRKVAAIARAAASQSRAHDALGMVSPVLGHVRGPRPGGGAHIAPIRAGFSPT